MLSYSRKTVISGLWIAALMPALTACTGDQWVANDPIITQITTGYGRPQWQATRYLRFDFVVRVNGKEKARFKHLWDRWTGRYRYEADATAFAGAPFFNELTGKWEPLGLDLPNGRLVGAINRNTGNGAVYIDHQLQDPTLIPRILERIDNDTFWLLLPLELDQALARGEAEHVPLRNGSAVITYRFAYPQGSGITPNDQWMLMLEPQKKRIYRTKVKPQNTNKVIAADWRKHTTINGITFSLERVMTDKTITFESLTMPQSLSDAVFVDPTASMP